MRTNDIERELAAYFDGIKTAGETMTAIAHLECKGRTQLAKHCMSWLGREITAEQAIARIRKAYNL